MEAKKKKCKGNSKAINYGCGELHFLHKFGLCRACFVEWLYNTPEGDLFLKSTQIRAKKVTQKKERSEQRQKKELIRSKHWYEKKLEAEVNQIVRLLDNDKGCISWNHGADGNWTRQKHAGHRLSVGSNSTLRYHLCNIHVQDSICNNWKSGNEREYDKGIIERYGQEYLDMIKSLPAKYKELHLSIDELKQAIINARKVKAEILDGKDYTREEINQRIGIYK